jgi:hypothetical protein
MNARPIEVIAAAPSFNFLMQAWPCPADASATERPQMSTKFQRGDEYDCFDFLHKADDGNNDAASNDAGHRNWYQLTLCQEQRESHQEALYTTS